MNCEECEDTAAEFRCSQCGQAMCAVCDKKIHNKGNRLLHVRERIEGIQEAEEVVPQSPLRKVDAHTLRH
jgi:hypothetical protein